MKLTTAALTQFLMDRQRQSAIHFTHSSRNRAEYLRMWGNRSMLSPQSGVAYRTYLECRKYH